MPLFLATIALVMRPQISDARLTYTHSAARAAVLLPEIGNAAGIELQSSTEMGNEVLLISVKDAPISEVLNRIAAVTSGRWTNHGSVGSGFAADAASGSGQI